MRKTILLFVCLIGFFTASAQTIEQLKQQISRAEQEIRLTNDILSKTQKEQSVNSSQLLLVRNNITNRRNIISNLDKQISLINSDIRSKNNNVSALEKELSELKEEYADMIYSSYKNYKLNNFMAFLFAAKDFNDITRRIYYMKRYTSMRQQKAVLIDSLSCNLKEEILSLETKKSNLDSTLNYRSQELTKLSDEEKNYRIIDTKLRSEAKKYNDEIKKKQNDIAQLEKKIQQIIQEQARKQSTVQRNEAESEYFVKLSGKFEQNKGKLPYPVAGGVVIEKFGRHQSAMSNQITVNKQGVSIAGTKGANVRAVFDGEVSDIFSIGIWEYNIAVTHGEYMTIYCNMGSISVKKGDKIEGNQILGQLSTHSDNNYTLEFSIAKINKQSAVMLDPEQWLKR
ncbi:MAG: peptidoglycan DD-metalloendopeptidase family protein [Rikenellaceae bacterium]|nr:peptidoglycan DD-metalloendopeptidase family protein [Rikenellaceae bacterium]